MDTIKQFNPAKTVCFAGHRPDRLPQDAERLLLMRERLAVVIEDAVRRGNVNFVSGAMSGFDVEAAEQVIRLKDKYPQIQCIMIAPFSVRFFNAQNWTPAWIARLRAVIRQTDFALSLSEHSYKGVYFDRDRMIVDMSSEVIAYYDGGPGGTKYTLDYARVNTNHPQHCGITKRRVTLMQEQVWELTDWIYRQYGQAGLLAVLATIIVLMVLAYILFNRLPESPNVIVWSKCSSCRYKRKKRNVFVLACRRYEKPRWNQFSSPLCPAQGCKEGCKCIAGLQNPSVFKRDELPEEVDEL